MGKHGGKFCVCDDCTVKQGAIHKDADAACGREWVCQCGSCKRARVIEINRAFKRLEDAERRLAHVRAIKAIVP